MPKRGPKPRVIGRVPGGDFAPPEGPGACPGHLSGDAAWARGHLGALLDAAGNLRRPDRVLLEPYALNLALLRRAYAAIEADGVVLVGRFGRPTAHPACAVLNAATMRLKALVEALGLGPASARY